jgi:hypothetical protein
MLNLSTTARRFPRHFFGCLFELNPKTGLVVGKNRFRQACGFAFPDNFQGAPSPDISILPPSPGRHARLLPKHPREVGRVVEAGFKSHFGNAPIGFAQ